MLDRRGSRRFRFDSEWKVTVKGTDARGVLFDEQGALGNLSSTGALVILKGELCPGEKVEVWIRVPFERENWITYQAEVIRVQKRDGALGVAVRFDQVLPGFVVEQAAPPL